jgi:prepilin-type N-terminal cleavage/methylation domain-containing protein
MRSVAKSIENSIALGEDIPFFICSPQGRNFMRNLPLVPGNGTIPTMQKQKGFTLLELVVVIVLLGIVSGAATPSLQRWIQQQRFDADGQEILLALSDARADAFSDRTCDGDIATEWNVLVNEDGIVYGCKQGGGGQVTISTTPFASDAAVLSQGTSDLLSWVPLGDLSVSVFSGGMNARIDTTYQNKWARVILSSPSLGREETVCYSRVANYPFLSPTGSCEEN